LMAITMTSMGYPINVVAKTIRYAALNKKVIDFRQSGGVQTIERGSAASTKKILKVFRENKILGLLIDQDARVPSVSVPFFGHPARTPVGAGELSIRMGAPVVLGFISRHSGGHRVVIHPPIYPPKGRLRGHAAAKMAAELTAQYTKVIEQHVSQHPADWAWMHQRWAK